jgi:hypothetical protein
LVAFDKSGRRRTEWEAQVRVKLASAGDTISTLGVEFAPDGTTYITVAVAPGAAGGSVSTTILALGPDGSERRGWPFRTGGLSAWVQPVAGGPTWVWWAEGGSVPTGARLAALGPDGDPLPGWPVAAPVFVNLFSGLNGRTFLITAEGGRNVLEEFDSTGPS